MKQKGSVGQGPRTNRTAFLRHITVKEVGDEVDDHLAVHVPRADAHLDGCTVHALLVTPPQRNVEARKARPLRICQCLRAALRGERLITGQRVSIWHS
jgi:hypothetical protein